MMDCISLPNILSFASCSTIVKPIKWFNWLMHGVLVMLKKKKKSICALRTIFEELRLFWICETFKLKLFCLALAFTNYTLID
jgi:hypothetical protein